MFVGSTILSGTDRLSPRSVMAGRMGSILGLIATVAFIILCFVLFLGPVISYFKGDYVQSYFETLKSESLPQITGCDFKLAVSFHKKSNKQPADHKALLQFLDPQVLYISPAQTSYHTDVQLCESEYFKEMQKPLHDFTPNFCYKVPDKLEYTSQRANGYISVFGFDFNLDCKDPFICTKNSHYTDTSVDQMLTFFTDYYYQLYFTSNYLDDLGQVKKKWNIVYSTEWEGHETIAPQLYALEETQKVYMDDSIMPWVNNQTIQYTAWYGRTSGVQAPAQSVQSIGVRVFIATINIQNILFRDYRKLDWLLGMLGGGFFLLYLFFWVPCNYINKNKQKIKGCEAMIIPSEDKKPNVKQLKKSKINILWYLVSWIPFSLPCFKKNQALIYKSERTLDIVDLVKKLKVTVRNLRKKQKLRQFQPFQLQEAGQVVGDDQIQEEGQQKPQKQLDLDHESLTYFRKDRKVAEYYQTNPSVLAINETIKADENLEKLATFDKYSDDNNPKYPTEGSCLDKTKYIFKKIFTFFDIFAAKPMLAGFPFNFSVFGCLVTFLIMVLAILTFSLTIHNMSLTKTYMDQIFESPEQLSVDLVTGQDFKIAVCMNKAAFQTNLVIGEERVADFSFFQFTRKGSKQSIKRYQAIWTRFDLSHYFDTSSEDYLIQNGLYCFKPNELVPFKVSGSDHTDEQNYFGLQIKPYCSGSTSFCDERKQQTQANFLTFLNKFPLTMNLPSNKYYPQEGKMVTNPIGIALSASTHFRTGNVTESLDETIYMKTFQMINDRESWIVGEVPEPEEQTLSSDIFQTFLERESVDSQQLYYRFKIMGNGSTDRVIFTNYKVDFLLATIGGCFMFFYIIFGCFGQCYNQYRFKKLLSARLYQKDIKQNQEANKCDKFKKFFKKLGNILNIPFCKDKRIKQLENDIDPIVISQRTDNCYHLSTTSFNNFHEKMLALVYLRQRIKSDELVIPIQDDDDQTRYEDDDLEIDIAEDSMKRERKRRGSEQETENMVITEDEVTLQKHPEKFHESPLHQKYGQQKEGKASELINHLDLFKNNSQLTFEGKRSVQSICGGICCLLLLIFIILLVQHFLTIYFSNQHIVSTSKVGTNGDSQQITTKDGTFENRLDFNTGQNFAFALSFTKPSEFRLMDVSEYEDDANINLVKYTITRVQNSVASKSRTIPLVHCPRNYFEDFLSEYSNKGYYNDLENAFCIPKGTELTLKGNPDSTTFQYFSVMITNKQGNESLAKTKQFLANYIPRYHISRPLQDYNSGQIHYTTETITKSYRPQNLTNRMYNISFQKTYVVYDTAVNPSNELPAVESYDFRTEQFNEYMGAPTIEESRKNQLRFSLQDFINIHAVKKVKVNELFGLVGGCIILLFLGLGYFPRSFNQYRMRYLIGCKLYTIVGKKHSKRHKKLRHSLLNVHENQGAGQTMNFPEWKILLAWLMSYWAYLTNNYNFNRTIRLVSLIESRVSKDINLAEFMQNLQRCRISLRRMLKDTNNLDLTDIYMKKLQSSEEPSLKEFNNPDQHLKTANRYNNFTDRQLAIIENGRQHSVSIQQIFDEKWLDHYFNVSRHSISRTGSQVSSNSHTSSVNQSEDRFSESMGN